MIVYQDRRLSYFLDKRVNTDAYCFEMIKIAFTEGRESIDIVIIYLKYRTTDQ